MPARVLHAGDAHWRPSNQMGVRNCDLGRQLAADPLTARLWLFAPGQASTRHRHIAEIELYVVLAGTGRMRIDDDEPLTLAPRSSVLVEPSTVRQIFNDTAAEALWLVVGTPPEFASTLEMTDEQLTLLYPDGLRALPPELS
ncbi:MAG: cupin domain-containing protein [Solirubrobacteraceae bacterium]